MKNLLIVITAILIFVGAMSFKLNKSNALNFSPPPTACDNLVGIDKIICLVDAFKATLSATQITTVQIPFTTANAVKWSNLPGGVTIRNGLEYSTLTTAQLNAALAIVESASGTAANEGFAEFQQVRAADTYLGTKQANYGEGKYIIAFLGNPSATGKWMLQFGGHHYAQNITFDGGKVSSVTPSHQGVEPLTFTNANGTFQPLQSEHAGMLAMLSSLNTIQLAAAKLSSTFSDVLLGPKKDGQFPATKLGVKCSTLTPAQKNIVIEAMKPWINDCDDATGARTLALYTSELDDTYISYAGNATLSNNSDYVRIDGPSVWIELACQGGIVFSGIHYHCVYRDHTRDYGAGNSLSPIKETYGAAVSKEFVLGTNYPNPFTYTTNIPFHLNFKSDATITVFDMNGKVVSEIKQNDLNPGDQTIQFNYKNLGIGTYIYKLKIKNNNGEFSDSKLMFAF